MPPSRQSSLKGAAMTAPARAGSIGAGAANFSSSSSGAGPATPKSAGSVDALTFGSTGRITPQSANPFAHSASSGLTSRPGSAAAVNRRRSEQATASPIDPHLSNALPHSNHHGNQLPPSAQTASAVYEMDGAHTSLINWDDDERDKGHGTERRASANFMSASGRWTPTILSNMLRRAGEGRFSPVNAFHTDSGSSSQSGQHASPQVPRQRQFTPSSPRPKTFTTEPEEIEPTRKQTPARSRSELANDRRATEKQDGSGHRSGNAHLTQQQVAGTVDFLASSAPAGNGYYPPAHMANAGSPLQSRSSHPLSHGHKMSTSSISAGSHSMHMHSPHMHTHSRHASLQKMSAHPQQSPVLAPTGNSSPLVIPQARRGAVNLRQACRRRKASSADAARKRAEMHAAPAHLKFLALVQLVVWTLFHPLSAYQSAKTQIASTVDSVDAAFRDPRTNKRLYRPPWLGAYIPLLIWLGVSLSSTFTVLIWHTQVFQALDRMSAYLQSLGFLGRLIFGALIFITTFPPLPLYSTLIILCGFSFGLWQSFVISYIAALSGAIVVFVLSRNLLKGWMVGLLNQSGGLKKVVRAIEKRPKLLFLVRLAPYPYNLMNTLLASSPTLTLKTYTLCTALALPKLLVHCGLGTTIKNFAAYNGAGDATPSTGSVADQEKASETAELVKHIAGFVGVGLCVGIFLYLFSVARKAVDEELDDDDALAADEYELMLSEGEEETASMDELENDTLSIANHHYGSREDGSSESSRMLDDPSNSGSSHRTSNSHIGNDIRLMRANGQSSLRIKGSGEAMPAESRNNALLSIVNQQKVVGANDGTTPLFIAPGAKATDGGEPNGYNGSSSYFGGWTGGSYIGGAPLYSKVSASSHSRTSLADSIVEMEKHASLLDSPTGRNRTISRPPIEQRHDISIELSPPPSNGRRAQRQGAVGNSADQNTKHPYDSHHQNGNVNSRNNNSVIDDDDDDRHVDDRSHLIEVDRNRASRRSQIGYEEEHIVGSSHR